MEIVDYRGKTPATDFVLSVGKHGFYFCISRLDGGCDFRPSMWRLDYSVSGFSRWLQFGPFDFMWYRKHA